MPSSVVRLRCTRHGMLPSTEFYASDLAMKRRRCRECSREVKAAWRSANPAQRVWKTFVQRAKRKFGDAALAGVKWSTHGRPLLGKFAEDIAQRIATKGQHLRLVW